jgi:hypothetical protein
MIGCTDDGFACLKKIVLKLLMSSLLAHTRPLDQRLCAVQPFEEL